MSAASDYDLGQGAKDTLARVSEFVTMIEKLGQSERILQLKAGSSQVLTDALAHVAGAARAAGANRLATRADALAVAVGQEPRGPVRWLHDRRIMRSYTAFMEAAEAALQASGEASPGAVAAQGAQRTVLVVDDEAVEMDIVERALQPDARVIGAATAQEAMETLAEETPDLIIIDMNLGAWSGKDFLAQLQHDPKLCKIPAVMRSNSEEDRNVIEGLAGGALDYIPKSVSRREFRTRCMDLFRYGQPRLYGTQRIAAI